MTPKVGDLVAVNGSIAKVDHVFPDGKLRVITKNVITVNKDGREYLTNVFYCKPITTYKVCGVD
jgi:hypothetical protein